MNKEDALEYYQQAQYFLGTEQYEDALAYIEKAVNADRMNVDFYILKGIVLANLDRFDDAITEFSNALKVQKDCAEAYFHLGNIHMLQGSRMQGLENYNKAIAYGYDHSQIFYNLGMMYEEDGNDELAIRNYTKAILADPTRSDARIRKTDIYISNHMLPEALENLNELILADPDLFDGYHLKALLLAEMGKGEEALQVTEEAMALFPKDPAFPLDQINILVILGKKEEAEKLTEEISNRFELNLSQKRQLELEKARLYAMDGEIDRVVTSLTAAKKFSEEADANDIDPEATFLLVNCLMELEQYQEAAEYSGQLIECGENEYAIPAYYMLPLSLAKSGETERAGRQYRESVAKLRAITLKNPGMTDGYLFRALCLKEIAEYEKALELCEYLLKIDDKSQNFHRAKAEVLYAMGREEEAVNERNLADSLA